MSDVGPLTIAVLVKQVPDMDAARIDRTSGRVVTSPQLGISSYDRYGIEAALRLKEAFGGEVIAVTCGPASARDVVSRALAMGADRGVHLELPDVNATDTLSIAQLLAGAVQPLACHLIIAGQTSDDLEAGQVGAQVAELLGVPVISNVVEIRLEDTDLIVRRDMEDGYQTVRATLPAMILSSTGLDEPRVASVKGIMAAKKKPVETSAVTASDENRISWEAPYVPPKTVTGTILQDVPPAEAARQLVVWLQEQKLI
jgi:electron transfer flavoprotein beta subunit